MQERGQGERCAAPDWDRRAPLVELGARLRQAARDAQLRSHEIARRMCQRAPSLTYSPSTIRTWWTGRNEPSYPVVCLYAEIVGKPVEYFYSQAGLRQQALAFLDHLAAGVPPAQATDRVWGDELALTAAERLALDAAAVVVAAAISRQTGGRPWAALSEAEKLAHVDAILAAAQARVARAAGDLPPE